MQLPEHLIASNQHGKYCVPASSRSRPAAAAVLAGRVWERKTIEYMAKRCASGDIVHAGAYFGDFLPGLSNALKPDAHLWAFEPSAENYSCAKRTLELNDIGNATLFHAGLGAKSETRILCTGRPMISALGGASRFVRKKKPGYAYEETQILAVDEVVPSDRMVSIVQLDVEGYEEQALRGALKTIRRNLPILILENLPKNAEWFRETILALGYGDAEKLLGNKVFAAPC